MWSRIQQIIYPKLDLIVLLICLVLTYGSWQYLIKNDRTQITYLDNTQARLEQKITSEIDRLHLLLDGVRGLYESTEKVTSDELSSYIKATDDSHFSTSLLRISYVERVLGKKTDGLFVVSQVADAQGNVYPPSGIDLSLEKKRQEMITKVLATKQPVITAVESFNNVPEYSGPGLIFTVPIIKNQEVVGLINGLISREDFLKDIQNVLSETRLISWQMGSEEFVSTPAEVSNIIKRIIKIPVTSEQTWDFIIAKTNRTNQNLNWILGGGVLISFILYVMVYGLSSANVRATAIANKTTQELMERKQFIETVMANLFTGIAVNYISTGKTIYTNEAFEKIYGWTKDQLSSVEDFFIHVYPDTQVREAMKQKILADIASGDPKRMSWDNVEITTSTGEKKFVDARNIPLPDQDIMVSTVIDVTEKKIASDEREKQLEKTKELNAQMVGRELKMIELKKEIEELTNKQQV